MATESLGDCGSMSRKAAAVVGLLWETAPMETVDDIRRVAHALIESAERVELKSLDRLGYGFMIFGAVIVALALALILS